MQRDREAQVWRWATLSGPTWSTSCSSWSQRPDPAHHVRTPDASFRPARDDRGQPGAVASRARRQPGPGGRDRSVPCWGRLHRWSHQTDPSRRTATVTCALPMSCESLALQRRAHNRNTPDTDEVGRRQRAGAPPALRARGAPPRVLGRQAHRGLDPGASSKNRAARAWGAVGAPAGPWPRWVTCSRTSRCRAMPCTC
jgi:hypothetical protein